MCFNPPKGDIQWEFLDESSAFRDHVVVEVFYLGGIVRPDFVDCTFTVQPNGDSSFRDLVNFADALQGDE